MKVLFGDFNLGQNIKALTIGFGQIKAIIALQKKMKLIWKLS